MITKAQESEVAALREEIERQKKEKHANPLFVEGYKMGLQVNLSHPEKHRKLKIDLTEAVRLLKWAAPAMPRKCLEATEAFLARVGVVQ